MRAPIIALAGIAAGLGFACAYLASELAVERGRSEDEAARRHDLEIRVPELQQKRSRIEGHIANPPLPAAGLLRMVQSSKSAGANLAQAAPSAHEPGGADAQGAIADRVRAYRSRLARRLQDPAARELLRSRQKIEARRYHVGLAGAMHLTPDEEGRLLDLLADQEIMGMELSSRSPDEPSVGRNAGHDLQRQNQQELMTLLGPERYQQYKDYQHSIPEQAQIAALRARLDETNALTDDQAARLVAAMREERDRYLSERAVGSGVYQSTYPFTLYSLDADPATQVTSGESQIKATQAFLGRIHDRAAALLTDEQLRRFAELQEEQLVTSRETLQRMREGAAETKPP